MPVAKRAPAWDPSRAPEIRSDIRDQDELIAPPPNFRPAAVAVAPPADPSRAAAEWRALSRRLELMHAPRGVMRAVSRWVSRAIWPLRAAVMSAKRVARHGPSARRAGGPSLLIQFLRQWSLCVRTGLWPNDYYVNRLFLPEFWAIADQFITSEQALPVLWALSPEPERSCLNNKREFQSAAARLGLPHARIVAAFGDGATELACAATLPRGDLFAKWTDSFAGQGVQCWRWDVATETYARDGVRLSAEQLTRRFTEESRGAGGRTLIIQRRVENHPALAGYSSVAACTARIISARALCGEPQALNAVLRMPRAGSVVDNLSAGGIAAPIDLATGRLGRAFGDDATTDLHFAHPDTGAPIEGCTLPDWSEAIDLVLHAHRLFPQTGSIGWDVAFTPDGPLLIEANTGWGCSSIQAQSGRPLPSTPLAEMVKSYEPKWRETAPPPPWAGRRV